MMPRVAMVAFSKFVGRSDYQRWENVENLESWWEARTKKLAGLIPAGSVVLEFGAGRQQLKRLLAPGCTYYASDLTDRGPGTVVCDLNARPLPDLRYLKADVVVFGGVLEYMRDLPSLAQWLKDQAPIVITSYDCLRSQGRTLGYLVELFRRSNFGYMSHYSLSGLIAGFENAGFRCVAKDAWENQQLLVFKSKQLGD
jgi:hypothetical protein